MTATLISYGLFFGSLLADSDDLTTARAIRTAYEANRTALQRSGNLHFRFSVGYAPSLEVARRGEWTTRHTARGAYVYDGEHARYECLFSAEDHAEARIKRGDVWTSPLNSVRILTDGGKTLLDQVALSRTGTSLRHLLQIVPGNEGFYREVICPLDVGRPSAGGYDLGDALQRATEPGGDLTLAVVADEAVDGRNVVHLTVSLGDARRDYWVDIERGAIPIRVQSSEGGRIVRQVAYDDIRQVNDFGWWPHRETIHFEKSGLTKQFTALDATFGSSVERSAFRLEFEDAVPVVDTVTMRRYQPQRVWDLRRLPGSTSSMSRQITVSPYRTSEAAMPGEREPRPAWVIPGFVLAAAALVAAAYVYAGRR